MKLPNPEITRICRGFALLLGSGIGAAEGAFLLAREEQGELSALLDKMGQQLEQGLPLAEAMERTGGFPEYVRVMVHIGEETGRLEETLNALANYYEENSRTLGCG